MHRYNNYVANSVSGKEELCVKNLSSTVLFGFVSVLTGGSTGEKEFEVGGLGHALFLS